MSSDSIGTRAASPGGSEPLHDRDPRRPAWFRQVLGQYPTGVCVITGLDTEGEPAGLIVGSFTSVSLEPPLVAFLPDKASTSWPKIRPREAFCVNVLSHDQEHLCRQFAAKGGDKFAGVDWHPAPTGSPVLDDVVAWIDCRLEAVHEAGDHDIVIGQVVALDLDRRSRPLLFFQGGYGRFAPLSLAVGGGAGLRHELQLVDRARPVMEALAADLDGQCVVWAMLPDELVLLASAGEPRRRGVPRAMIGARIPAVPPAGATWMAHAPSALLEAWLHRAPPHAQDEFRRRVAQVRERGYTVALRGPELSRLEAALTQGRTDGIEPAIRSLPLDPLDFDATQAREVTILDVPVVGPDGTVALLLGLHGFPTLRDGVDLEAHVARLQEAAGEIARAAVTSSSGEEGSRAPSPRGVAEPSGSSDATVASGLSAPSSTSG